MSTYAQIIDFLVAGLESEAGHPLSGGKVDSYNAGLGTRKDTYTVRDKSAVSTNPIILDVYGRAVVYGDGIYKFVIKDASDNVIKTIDNYSCLDLADHSARHEDGGDDEISLHGLSGLLDNIHLASQISGVVLDCNIYTGAKIGGGTPTDNTAAINALLITATQENPITLVIDGGAAVKTLIIPNTGYVSIIGLGWHTGFFVMDAADGDFLRTVNHVWDPPDVAEPIAGYNVHFKDFYVNANRPGNSTTGDLRGDIVAPYWYTGFHIHAIKNLTWDNVYIYDSPSFGATIYGCVHVRVRGGKVESPLRSVNTDGYHFNGGCHDVIVNGPTLATGDDAIAINVDEGDGQAGYDFILNNVVLDDCYGALRIYGKAKSTKNIIASNFVGTVRSYKVAYGLELALPAPLDECNHSVTLSNWDVHYSGAIVPTTGDIVLTGSGGSLILDNFQVNSPLYALPILYTVATMFTPCTISNVVLNNCQIYRDDTGNANAYLLGMQTGTIKNFNINNFRMISQKDATYSTAITLILVTGTGVVSNLVLRSMDIHDVEVLWAASAGGVITAVNTGVKTRYIERDTAAVDGVVSYTGIGFRPSKVHFIATLDSTLETSDGFDDGTSHYCRAYDVNVWIVNLSYSIALYQTGAIYALGKITAFIEDGFTITWAKTGAKVGTATILCMAYE